MEFEQNDEMPTRKIPLLTRRQALRLNAANPDEPSPVRTETTYHDELNGTETLEDVSLQALSCGHVIAPGGAATLAGVCHTCKTATLCTTCAVKNACLRCKKLCCPDDGKTIRRQFWYCKRCWWWFAMPQHVSLMTIKLLWSLFLRLLKLTWFLFVVACKASYILVKDVFRILGFLIHVAVTGRSTYRVPPAN